MQIPWFETTASGTQTVFVGPADCSSTCDGTQSLTFNEDQFQGPYCWVDDAQADDEEPRVPQPPPVLRERRTGRVNVPLPRARARVRERGIGHLNFRARTEGKRAGRWDRKRPR